MNKFLFLVLVALIWGNYSFALDADEEDALQGKEMQSAAEKDSKDVDWDSVQPVPKTGGFDSGFSGGVSGAVNDAIDKANANVQEEKEAAQDRRRSAEEAEKENPEAFRIKPR